MKRYLLRGDLEVAVVPAWGGKTVSIRHRSSGHELLFQRGEKFRPKGRTDFGEWAFGWDDCWPSIEAQGPDYPDHGAVWGLVGRVLPSTEGLAVEVEAADRTWRYTKTWLVKESSLRVSVRIDNLGSVERPAFWTLHALVRVEDDMELVFPGADERKTVYGDPFSPRALPSAGRSGKFWLPAAVQRGSCGIDYPSLGMTYRLNWDPADLPYLGTGPPTGGFAASATPLGNLPTGSTTPSRPPARTGRCLSWLPVNPNRSR
jgi:hypothetical protein